MRSPTRATVIRRVVAGLSLTALFLTALAPVGSGSPKKVSRRTSSVLTSEKDAPQVSRPVLGRTSGLGSRAVEVYQDPANDAGAALDIEQVAIRNVEGGLIFIDLYTDQESLDALDRILFFLDTDANRLTGDLGADYLIDVDPDFDPVILLGRWMGNGYDYSVPQNSLALGWDGQGGYFIDVAAAELGNTTAFNLEIWTLYPDDPNATQVNADIAPDQGFWSFVFDMTPPQVRALKSGCAKPCSAGKEIPLAFKYTVFDDIVREKIQVFSSLRSSPVFVWESDYSVNEPNTIYSYGWPVPRNPKGWHRFCVTPTDLAGNTGRRDCAKIVFPRIRTDARVTWTQYSSFIILNSLKLRGLPDGTKVTVDCARGCSLHEQTTTGGRFSSKRFKGKVFGKGAVIKVRAMHARWVGHYEKLTVVLGAKGISQTTRCMAPGTTAPSRRCS